MGAPLVQVARLLAEALALFEGESTAALYGLCLAASISKRGAGLSDLPIKDRRNHDDFVDKLGESPLLGLLKLLSDCLRPSNRAVDDFGRNGSTASAKYS